jgi:hypothetical protein
MQVIQLQPSGKIEYGQTNGTLIKKSSGRKIVKQEIDDGDDEEEEEVEETIIKKTRVIKKKKKTKSVVSGKFILCNFREHASQNFEL